MQRSASVIEPAPPPGFRVQPWRPALSGVPTSSAGSYLLALFVAFQVSYLLKRAIFLFFQPSQTDYYAVIALPIPFLIVALLITKSAHDGKTSISTGAIWFLLLLGSAWTVLSGTGAESVGTIFLEGAPLCGFFLGMTLRGRMPRSLLIAYLVAIFVSVIYGTVQFFVGMTPMEIAWAQGTAAYSMQAQKALLVNIGESLRPFSYFPDTMTWNTFLVAAGTIVWIGRMQRLISKGTFLLAWSFVLIGMFVALSRNVWLLVAVMVPVYFLLRKNLVRSGGILFAVVIGTFFAATTGSQYVIDRFSVGYRRFDDALENRYAQVGTLHDRAISYDLLANAVARYPLIGEGFSAKVKGSRAQSEVEWLASHNMVVDGIVYWGAVGSLAYLVFLFTWLVQSVATSELTNDRQTRQIVMFSIAYILGAIAEGQFSGLPSLPFEFYFIAGFVSGLYLDVKRKNAFRPAGPARPAARNALTPPGGPVRWRSNPA